MAEGTARRNWAGNHTYCYARWHEPTTIQQLRGLVAGSTSLRVVGSRHCFNDVADTRGDLVSLRSLPLEVEIDTDLRVARVSAWSTYGEVAPLLHAAGWALPNTASLPDITVGGAIATGSHGSGDANVCLGGPVVAVEYVDAFGDTRLVDRADPDFAGHVVALGALGVWTHAHLALEPTFEVSQSVRVALPWSQVLADLTAVTSAAYSVSLFTDFASDLLCQAWFKSRADQPEPSLDVGRPAAPRMIHMLTGADPGSVAQLLGRPGPWHERLPHFRPGFAPSFGSEIQSEYLLPRAQAVCAVERLRAMSAVMAPALQVAEIRSVAADDLWLSPSSSTDSVAFHFTWTPDRALVDPAVSLVEAALLPLGARPHWGKFFKADSGALATAYPRLGDFQTLRARLDPRGVFDNAYLQRVLGRVDARVGAA